ncbi:MAG: energy transducer TonB, partial [Prevotella sp.]|nr:energy transducer TonB [Prevotella sp.]
MNEKRGTFFVLGIILALSLLFVSLEYTSREFDSFLDDEYLDDLAQDFELLPSMDEEEELETASQQERTTVLTENIKVTNEVPSEIDNTSIPTP